MAWRPSMRVAQLCRSLDSSIGEPLPFGSLRACRISLPIETREDGGIGRRGGCHVCRCSWAVRLRYWRGELDGGTRFTAIGQRDLNAHATRQVHLAHVARTRGRRHVEGEDPVTGWRTLPFTLHGVDFRFFTHLCMIVIPYLYGRSVQDVPARVHTVYDYWPLYQRCLRTVQPMSCI